VVLQRSDEVSWKSLRNISGIHVLVADQLNTYDVLCADDVIFTRGALEEFLAGPARGKGAKAVASDLEADAAVQSGDDSNTEEAVQ
jgi:large subunit ribosomal protein L4